MNLFVMISQCMLMYLSIGLCWFAWLWCYRSNREMAETRRIQQQYGRVFGVVILVAMGALIWPWVIVSTVLRRRR